MVERTNISQKSKRGGRRPGAGRPKGARNKATLLEKRALSDIAKDHAPEALEALLRVLRAQDAPYPAVVSAATAIWDRGFGRPVQAMEHTGKDGGPIETIDLASMSPVEREQRLLAIQQELASSQDGESMH